MLEIKNAVACPPENFYFFYAASGAVPVEGEEYPSSLQLMIGIGGLETGDRATDITYSAMPRFFAVAQRADWRFHIGKYPAFGLAAAIAGDQASGWRIDGMIDRNAMWRAWRTRDEQKLSQQLALPVRKVLELDLGASFDEFAEKIVMPLMPRRRMIIQKAWSAMKEMPSCHWSGSYMDSKEWRKIDDPEPSIYHNWNACPVWEKDGSLSWKRSRKLISMEGKFLCGRTIRTLNREVMSVVEKLEAGTFTS